MPDCVALGDKIYVFTYKTGKVFNPQSNEWDDDELSPPTGVDNWGQSKPLLTDPSKNHMLLHFKHLNSLYAYYPNDSRWELLVEGFCFWTSRVVFDNDVLFFYQPVSSDFGKHSKYNVICAAYDVAEKKWLKVSLDSAFNQKVRRFDFDAFFNFGNGLMCLAAYSPKHIPPKCTSIFTVQFEVKRQPNSKKVVVTFISYIDHTIDDDCSVANYIAVGFNSR